MAGWTSPNRELIEWDGTIGAKKFIGDGSRLTNLPSGSETDPVFLSLSGAFIKTESDPIFIATSGAFLKTESDPVFLSLSGAFLKAESDPIWISQSGGYTKTGVFNTLSSAYYTHAADSSDPHGTNLTQTNINSSGTISGGVMIILNDKTVSGSAYVSNTIYGTDSTPPTASNFPIGSIYYQYIP